MEQSNLTEIEVQCPHLYIPFNPLMSAVICGVSRYEDSRKGAECILL